MLDLLRFILSGFWTFAGTVALLVVVLEGTTDLVRAIRGTPYGSSWRFSLKPPKPGKPDAN